ncbi:hypothetical protein D781_0052 [Serratia sp. FGI94]|uniref:hypothetical protein n=1 Tax=Serratia sp. FGI94 TaxID=671990 RepID=UPI0002A70DA9|nr:hypothetical protein [Serratia sp. FGI94]AGB80453.1 hypothetical protein D781_0052 [Serratia sp. FGI94]
MKDYTKTEIERKLDSDDLSDVTDALLYLTFNIDDFNWVQDVDLKMLDHPNEEVCSLAITCLGHIARIYSKIDKEKVIPCLKNKAKDKRFTGRVEDAMDDISMFT